MKWVRTLICVAMFGLTNLAAGAEPVRPVKLLVVLRARDAVRHFQPARGHPLGEPVWITDSDQLNAAYKSAAMNFDRDSPLKAALMLAFRDRAPFVDIATSADRDRYLSGALFGKPKTAAREEGFDFILALYDDFIGFAPRNGLDDENAVLSPEYGLSYGLFELASNRVMQRGSVRNFGFEPARFDGTTQDLALFPQTWPYLCLVNTTEMVDELVRNDAVHDMAARGGRGAEYPAVHADIEAYRKRLDWRLSPAPGWSERASGPFTRVLFPKGDLSRSVRMHVDAELLLPALGQAVDTAEEFMRIHDRDRARLMPDAPLERFTNVAARGYSAWRYAEPSGEHVLVFIRRTSAVTMQVMTLTISGDFDAIYPSLRGKIEQMLEKSTVGLH